jgi:hypothetical protein
MTDEAKELKVLRRVVAEFAWCGIARRREHGWETALLKDVVRERCREAGITIKEGAHEHEHGKAGQGGRQEGNEGGRDTGGQDSGGPRADGQA